MRKGILLLLLLLSISSVFAKSACDLDVNLLNQDPYPAIPGEYVKLVFQLRGLDSPDCKDITFDLVENYPIEFNPGETGFRSFKKIDYVRDYSSTLLIPYEVRLDKNALDKSTTIEIKIRNKGDSEITKKINLEVKDVRVDFETYVTNYDYITKELTIEVLNIGSSDVEALTLEIPKQDGISVKGSNRIVVGDLDSNEYTSADFEITLSDGEFKINLIYSDSINVRRMVEEKIVFDSSYFTERVSSQKTTGIGSYIVYVLIALAVLYFIYRKTKKAKAKKK